MPLLFSKRLSCTLLLAAFGGAVAPQAAQAGTEPFLGEVTWVAFNFAPRGWLPCNGALLPINQNQALFALLGTTYGGDGQTTFALPDMRSRALVHHDSVNYFQGQRGGEETHTLTLNELPQHTHAMKVDPREATLATPGTSAYLAKTSGGTTAYDTVAAGAMAAGVVSTQSGSYQAHNNVKPVIAMTCIIAVQGIFPSQN